MDELALFAGAGLGLLGTHHLLGWRAVGYVEMAEYPCKVLEARIKDGLLSKAPIFQMHTRDFIRLGLAEKYRGVARVITAGFPCQPFSGAGLGLADKDPRNGWPDTIAIIRLVRPQYILLENVSRLVSSPYFGVILSDLAQSGYDFRWDCIPAAAVGAPHERDRLWIVAYSDRTEWGPCSQPGRNLARDDNGLHANGKEAASGAGVGGEALADPDEIRRNGRAGKFGPGWGIESKDGGCTLADSDSERELQPQGVIGQERRWTGNSGQEVENAPGRREWQHQDPRGTEGAQHQPEQSGWWAVEPELGRVANGVPHRVDRLKAIGNGQVPAVVREVWRTLTVRAA